LDSEFKRDVGYFEIFWFREFVFQCRQEFRVDFVGKRLHIFNDLLQLFLLVACVPLHLFVPGVDSLDGFGREDEGGSSDLGLLVLEQGSIEKGDFLKVLGKEEDLIVRGSVGQFSESLQKSE